MWYQCGTSQCGIGGGEESMWNHMVIISAGSAWDQCGISVESVWDQCGISVGGYHQISVG